jgi:hypothetical protein
MADRRFGMARYMWFRINHPVLEAALLWGAPTLALTSAAIDFLKTATPPPDWLTYLPLGAAAVVGGLRVIFNANLEREMVEVVKASARGDMMKNWTESQKKAFGASMLEDLKKANDKFRNQ